MYPFVPLFFFFYIAQPIIHGNIYQKHYNNFQWDALYFKFSTNRPMFTDQTITRLAWVYLLVNLHFLTYLNIIRLLKHKCSLCLLFHFKVLIFYFLIVVIIYKLKVQN